MPTLKSKMEMMVVIAEDNCPSNHISPTGNITFKWEKHTYSGHYLLMNTSGNSVSEKSSTIKYNITFAYDDKQDFPCMYRV